MTLSFGPFALDRSGRRLLRAGQAIRLSPKAFELLMLLVARRPAAISKADIHKALWPDTFVSDVNLAILMAEVRGVLGDDARRPVYIRTVHRFGYAFAGTVVESGHSGAVNTRGNAGGGSDECFSRVRHACCPPFEADRAVDARIVGSHAVPTLWE